jgi:hypothetical protein
MKKLLLLFISITAMAVLINVPSASAQGALEGVWQIREVVIGGPNARTITDPAPSLFIFTKKHYSSAYATADRPVIPRENATDGQKLASWAPFSAEGGTYEVKGTILTIHPFIAKNTYIMKPGSFLSSDFKLEGNTLTLTAKTDQDGARANPVTFKLVRRE